MRQFCALGLVAFAFNDIRILWKPGMLMEVGEDQQLALVGLVNGSGRLTTGLVRKVVFLKRRQS
jgi:hypothetical protein